MREMLVSSESFRITPTSARARAPASSVDNQGHAMEYLRRTRLPLPVLKQPRYFLSLDADFRGDATLREAKCAASVSRQEPSGLLCYPLALRIRYGDQVPTRTRA